MIIECKCRDPRNAHVRSCPAWRPHGMVEQFRVAVPEEQRVKGWLYDFNSGVLLGIASDEQRKKQKPGVAFNMNISGCPHKVVIHG